MASKDIPKQYDPTNVEDSWYEYCWKQGFFDAEAKSGGTPYSIVIPPPNITAALHMGHALNNTIQDILIRWKRLQGCNTLWMPGTDHAGIATQNMVEKKLSEQGLSRKGLGREKFVKEVWSWKEEYGSRIIDQLRRLGASCDWRRTRFTMDDGLSNAVIEVFIRLYKKGLIYRGNYIINWCPRCQTALSDEESEHREIKGSLYYIKYPIEGSKRFVTVATTRPETMLGDVAVAIHPKDKRYKDLVDKTAILPILNRRLKVVLDDFVDPAFGTGVVKVTPAHDPNDFLIAQRHGLDPVNVMNEDATMNENAGEYVGMERFKCRETLLIDLKERGLLEKTKPHVHSVGHCYRCNTVVEPRLSLQWFVKMKPLAEPAIQAVKEGKITLRPERWTKVYLDWMENIRDWCISRQIWWGHRIPIWYCRDCGEITASKKAPAKCKKCDSTYLYQDEDVLDTWFSSWLWPFSTFGWPEHNEDLKFYYPTCALITAPEILFFWVARMIMAGLEFMGEVPFTDVYLHGTVRDASGRKMSKSLGNTIDPNDIIETFSADALRFSLVLITAHGQDVYLSQEKFEIGRNFANKLWNAARFILMNSEPNCLQEHIDNDKTQLSNEDRYILGRLNLAVRAITLALERYRFNEAAHRIYDFVWHDFCDRYIESAKSVIYGDSLEDKVRTGRILVYVLDMALRLLHPFMPFITEDIWQKLNNPNGSKKASVMAAHWPVFDPAAVDYGIIKGMEHKYEVIRIGRNLRSEYNINPSKEVRFIIVPRDNNEALFLRDEQASITKLLRASHTDIKASEYVPEKPLPSGVVGNSTIYLSLDGAIDIKSEQSRLLNQISKLELELKKTNKKLTSQDFINNAPKEVVEKEKRKRDELIEKKQKIDSNLSYIKNM